MFNAVRSTKRNQCLSNAIKCKRFVPWNRSFSTTVDSFSSNRYGEVPVFALEILTLASIHLSTGFSFHVYGKLSFEPTSHPQITDCVFHGRKTNGSEDSIKRSNFSPVFMHFFIVNQYVMDLNFGYNSKFTSAEVCSVLCSLYGLCDADANDTNIF